jgi:hypothetical protein
MGVMKRLYAAGLRTPGSPDVLLQRKGEGLLATAGPKAEPPRREPRFPKPSYENRHAFAPCCWGRGCWDCQFTGWETMHPAGIANMQARLGTPSTPAPTPPPQPEPRGQLSFAFGD